jgi:hypothetical protein
LLTINYCPLAHARTHTLLLQSFLEAKLPEVSNPKKAKFALGVNDHRLGQQIRDDCAFCHLLVT